MWIAFYGAHLPVDYPCSKAAKALGLNVPSSMLLSADEVIE
jgi:hypothetical protein